MEDIYVSSDSLRSPRSTIANVSSPPNVMSPPSRFNTIFNAGVKRCAICLTSVVHFLVLCSVCNKLTCCKCIFDVQRCCGIYLCSKVNRICRTPHYAFALDHACTLNQTLPPVNKYFDDLVDNAVQHARLVKAKFILNLLTIESINSPEMVFVLTTDLIKCINELESIFVHILFKSYICTSMLISNMSQINEGSLPELSDNTAMDRKFKMFYEHVRTTQKHVRKKRFVKTIMSQGTLLACLISAVLIMLL